LPAPGDLVRDVGEPGDGGQRSGERVGGVGDDVAQREIAAALLAAAFNVSASATFQCRFVSAVSQLVVLVERLTWKL